MKTISRCISLVLLISLIASLSTPSFATEIANSSSFDIDTTITFGEIQTLLEEHLSKYHPDIKLCTDLFFTYVVEQLFERTDAALLANENYILIDTYLARYKLMYEEYLLCKRALAEDFESNKSFIRDLAGDNPCLLFDETTRMISFSLTEEFLSLTLEEMRLNNQEKESSTLCTFQDAKILNTRSSFSYAATDAVAYALKYAKKANTNYPNFEADYLDCTNFISQCVHAGGIPMTSGTHLWGAESTTTKWYCRGTTIYTTSWTVTDDFAAYMSSIASRKMIVATVDEVYENCLPGDVVQLVKKSDGDIYHSTIITSKDDNTAYYCAHSSTRDGSSDDSIHAHFSDATDYFIIFSFDNTARDFLENGQATIKLRTDSEDIIDGGHAGTAYASISTSGRYYLAAGAGSFYNLSCSFSGAQSSSFTSSYFIESAGVNAGRYAVLSIYYNGRICAEVTFLVTATGDISAALSQKSHTEISSVSLSFR